MQAIPIPPPIPIQGGIEIPEPILNQPTAQPLLWEPVPMYIENIPQDIPTPNPNIPDQEESEEDTFEDNDNLDSSGKPNETTVPESLVPEMAEVQTWDVPLIGVEIPVPRTEILVTATTTAGISSVVAVGGTLFATTMFRQLQPILKPIFKTVFKKLAALQKKPPPLSWARERRQKKQRKELQ